LTEQKNIKLKRPHFKNLDSLRFLAAFAVFIFHFVLELKTVIPQINENHHYQLVTFFTSNGILGVNFFFVLSGFLITYLILFEIKSTRRFSLKKFFMRRALRIWPLYYLIVFIGFFIFPLIYKDYNTSHNWINYMFFLANFDEIYNGYNDSYNFLTSPWSVAVEEQFYLFFGILFFILTLFYKGKFQLLKLPIIIGFLLVIFFLMRYKVNYYHTISALPDILIGASLGYLFIINSKVLYLLKKMPKFLILFIYIIGFLFIFYKNFLFNGHFLLVQKILLALFFTFIILDQISFKNSIFKVKNITGSSFLGKMSYGIYMYQLVVMFIIQKSINFSIFSATTSVIIFLILSVLFTFVLSYISYKWFEKPFLSLKSKFI
jgi:peptidoglycan/LPS O-acetylase OafA/YrhL